MKHYICFTVILVIVLNVIQCDFPVHCLKSQVVGKWKFKSTQPKALSKLELGSFSCGHKIPSHESTSYQFNMNVDDFVELHELELKDNDEAVLDGNQTGHWTMIYDEGFEVFFGKPEDADYINLLILSKYDDVEQSKRDGNKIVKNEEIRLKSKWGSMCYASLISFMRQGNNWSCIYGEKIGENPLTVTNGEAENKQIVLENKIVPNFLEKQVRFKESLIKTKTLLKLDKTFKNHEHLVEAINNDPDSTWVAGIIEDFKFLSISELNERAGRRKRSTNPVVTRYPDLTVTDTKINDRKYIKPLKSGSKSDKVLLKSKQTSGREIDLSEYVINKRSQGNCGSCYAMATISMLEARTLFKNQNIINELKDIEYSLDSVLKCSVYNQGCDGGYAVLTMKYFQELDLLPKQCFSVFIFLISLKINVEKISAIMMISKTTKST